MEGNVVYPPNAKRIDAEQSGADLTKNLKALSEQLQEIDISKDNTKYMPLAEHLVQSKLVRHSSKDVRLYNGCCLADLLRICVPHNPVSEDTSLKELFSFFIRVLRGLEDVEGSNYHRYFYILESLATCKSFLLLGKLRSEETAITLTGKLFNLFFHIVSDAHVGKGQSLMLDIMSGLVNETNCMDNDLLELIYQHILPPFKHQMPAAYLLASDLLRLTANTIEPHVLNFFNDVMSPLNGADDDDFTPSKTPKSASKSSNGAYVNGGGGSRKKNSLTVQRIYELMYEVYATAPATLSPVLPLIEMKLKSLETDDRVLAVECLGKMFGHENSQLYLDNNNLWSAFLSRGRDASAEVRLKFLKAVPKILEYHFDDVGSDVCAMLTKLSRDTSTDIRKETIKTIEVVGFVNFSWVNLELLAAVKDRTRDTNWSVRKAAMTAGANWFQHCFSSSEKHLSTTSLWSQNGPRAKLSWVAPKLLANYYSAGNDEKIFVEDLLFSKVFADANDETTMSCLRFLEVFCEIDDQSCQILQALLKNGALKKRGFDLEIGKELISKICTFLARPEQSVLNNSYYSWEEIPQNKFKENDLRSVFDTQDSLIAISSSDDKKLRALGMCEFLFVCYPDLFCSTHCVCQFSNLLKFVIQRKVSVSYDVIKLIMRSVILLTNSVQEKLKNRESDTDEGNDLDGFESVKNNLLESVNSILAHSNDPKLCKYSVVLSCAIVTESEERSSMLAKMFKQLTNKISLASYNLLGILGAATQLAFVGAQELHGDLQKFISDFVTKQLIGFDICDLKEDDQDRFITAKVYGLKMITRWLIGLNGANLRLVESTLKMLSTGIINGGSFAERWDNNETSANDAEKECSMIRLTAAKMVLKLNAVKSYANVMTEEQFHVVSSVMLDPCQEVRSAFAAKLNRHCSSQRLQLKFLAPFAFCGREPSSDLKEKFRAYLKKNLTKRKYLVKNSKLFKSNDGTVADPKQKRQAVFSNVDNVMLHVVHLLAHFHEFDSLKNVEVLKALKDCLWFVMNILMYELDEFSYTYHKFMLDNLKMCKDATVDENDQESNEKLYAVCDLALTMLNARVKTFDSIAVTELSLAIPARLYKTDESVKDMNRKIYIPSSLTEKPKMILDASQAEKLKKKPQKSKQLQREDQVSNQDTACGESEVKSSKSKQTKISDHVMTSFVAPRSNRKAKKRYNLSSTEESNGASSSEDDTGSPDFKINISRKRKTKTNDGENLEESPSAKKVYSTRTRNRKVDDNDRNVLSEKVVNNADDKTTSESETSPVKTEVYNSTPAKKPKASPLVNSKTPTRISRNSKPWDAKIAQKSAEIMAKGKEKQSAGRSPTEPNKVASAAQKKHLKPDKGSSSPKRKKKSSISPDKRQSTISDLFGSSKTGRSKSAKTDAGKISMAENQEDKRPKRGRNAVPHKNAIEETQTISNEDPVKKRTARDQSKQKLIKDAPNPKRRTRATLLESDDNDSEVTSKNNSQKEGTPARRNAPRGSRQTPKKSSPTSQASSVVASPGSVLEEGTPSNRTRNRIKSVVQ